MLEILALKLTLAVWEFWLYGCFESNYRPLDLFATSSIFVEFHPNEKAFQHQAFEEFLECDSL